MTVADLLQQQYRAQDAANGDYIDYVAIDKCRAHLERTRPWRVPVFDSLSEEDQTREAWHYHNTKDAGDYAEEQR